MDVTQADIEALAERLAGLELPDGQREALRMLVAAAASADDPEVDGFFFPENGHRLAGAKPIGGLDFAVVGLKVGPPTRIVMTEETDQI